MPARLLLPALALLLAGLLAAGEPEADAISAGIQARHMPYGTLLDPMDTAPGAGQLAGYTRAADSAIWTGHYLAAEAFRYRVTRSEEALANARRALSGIRALVYVTGDGLLARCLIPADSPYLAGILNEEKHHGVYNGTLDGKSYLWIGNTSRDQYSGVFFGLGVAYEMIPDSQTRALVRDLVTRMLDRLLDDDWAVRMPGGAVSTVFWGRPDQQLSLLIVGRQVNPDRFKRTYEWQRLLQAGTLAASIVPETLDDHNSYFKFNLDVINLYNLLRLEQSSTWRRTYLWTYNVLRRTLDDHGNPHFNMIDRAVNGPDPVRDAETAALLEAWLRRPRTDEWVDLRSELEACGEDRACSVIPVEKRVRTDFLWQRSPFLLYGGGAGTIEGPGIDYILPYWMARYYGVL